MLIKANQACLLVIDVQERLLPAVADPEGVVRGCESLILGAQRLGLPVLVSEQYPRGIGHTVAQLRRHVDDAAVLEKMHFSCGEDAAIAGRLAALARPQVVVCGIEAHVCVLQSALRFQEIGYQVFTAADACSSRDPRNAEAAFARMSANGVEVVTTEMVLFEWLHRAGTPEFKDLLKLIR